MVYLIVLLCLVGSCCGWMLLGDLVVWRYGCGLFVSCSVGVYCRFRGIADGC